jgi:membrane protease subunit HflC
MMTPVKWNRQRRSAAVVASAIVLVWLSVFTVPETEFAIVTEFGRPVRTIARAGLHVRWPYQGLLRFDRRVRIYNPRPSEFLTKDKKNLVIENYVCWRIQNPERFVQTVGDRTAAEMRVHDIVWSGLAAALGNLEVESVVSADPQRVRGDELMEKLTRDTSRRTLEQYGIEVMDVRVKRLNLPEQNKQSVFARMRAERERIARQYRAEGEEQALKIRAEADRQREEILSAAYREAEQIKGDGDAQSTRIYGAAYARDPQFYKLVRTLEAYKKILDDKTTAVLSSDSELLRILTKGAVVKK